MCEKDGKWFFSKKYWEKVKSRYWLFDASLAVRWYKEELVEKKIVNELFGGDVRQFRKNQHQKRFWLATRVNKSTYYHESNLSLRERIRWRIKKSTFGVCHNNEPIRGSRGNLLRLFNLRLVFSKCLTLVLSFERIELGGLITSKSASKEGEVSPLVEFSYTNKKGIATIK